MPANYWSPDFAIDSSLFNTLSVVRQSVLEQEAFLREINHYVYAKINRNFTEFYRIVQKLNKFDQTARTIVADIEAIRSQFSAAKLLVRTEIVATQAKVRRQFMLREALKVLETVKYIDKANSTIRTLFEKTDFRKVSELLAVLKEGFDVKLRQIRVFQNKFEEVNRLRQSFVDNLSKLALGQLDSVTNSLFKDFRIYVQNFASCEDSVLSVEVAESQLSNVSTLLEDLRLFNEIDLSAEAATALADSFHKFNRELLADVAKQLVFRKPSVPFLRSYKNLVKATFTSFRCVFSAERSREAISQTAAALAKGTTAFFKKVFDVFDLHTITAEQINEVLELINSFGAVFMAEADSAFWQLQLAFKKLILNAKQLSFFQVLKAAMVDETWTPEELSEEDEVAVRSLLAGAQMEIFTKFVTVGETRFFVSRSFLMLVRYFADLVSFQETVGNLGTEFFTKAEEAVSLFLCNSENLLLNPGATSLKKVAKINTKMLGLITSTVRLAKPVSGRNRQLALFQKRSC